MDAYSEWVPGCDTSDHSSTVCLSIRILDASDSNVASLVPSLRRCTSLVHASVYACVPGLDSLKPLLDALVWAPALRSLHLRISASEQNAVQRHALSLGDCIKRLASLRDLGLHFDPCWQEQAVKSVCCALSSGLVLQGLSVGPHVGLSAYQRLSDVIGCNTHLRRLHFRCSRAGTIGEIIMRGVSANHGLLDISFSENVFHSNDSVGILSDVIKNHPTLRGLYMNCDHMTEGSARVLSGAFQGSRLERLFVVQGTTALTSKILLHGIKRSRCLTVLGGLLHTVDRDDVVDFVRVNRSVRTIVVRRGFMNVFGWPQVFEAYRDSQRLHPMQAVTGDAHWDYGRIFYFCMDRRSWALAGSCTDAARDGADGGYRWCRRTGMISTVHLPSFMRGGRAAHEACPDENCYAGLDHDWARFPVDRVSYMRAWQDGLPEDFLSKCFERIHAHCHLPRAVAVCMGAHHRLGGCSLLSALDTLVIDTVLGFYFGLQ